MTNAAIALSNQNLQLAQHSSLSAEQIELVKTTVMKGASDAELQLFIGICNRTKLDPFARQIFAVPRWDATLKKNVFTFQISIDGFRLLAARSGKYRGQTEPQFCDDQGQWHDIWIKDEPPLAARVGVKHADFEEPLFATAKYKNYVQTKQDGKPMAMWAKMPDHMLAKCAEALALRKAFPYELSDLYTEEEIQIEKQVQGPVIEVARIASDTGNITPHVKAAGEIKDYLEALAAFGIERYAALKTSADRQKFIVELANALNLEYGWGYQEISKFSELSEKHVQDVVGWVEGELTQAKEVFAEQRDEPLI